MKNHISHIARGMNDHDRCATANIYELRLDLSCYCLKLLALLAVFQLFLSPAFAQVNAEAKACSPIYTTASPIFRNLKEVRTIVITPGRITRMIECNTGAAACGDPSKSEDPYLKVLATDYKAYPPALHPDQLQLALTNFVSEAVTPYLQPDVNCVVAPVKQLTQTTDFSIFNAPQTLTVALKISTDDSIEPAGEMQTVSLTLYFYRPDVNNPSFVTQVLLSPSMPILIGQDEKRIGKQIEYLFKHSPLSIDRIGSSTP